MRKKFDRFRWFSALIIFFSFILFACKKEIQFNDSNTNEIAKFPVTEIEKQRVDLIKEVSLVLKEIYRNPYVVYEVNSTIKSEYYEDESVLLKDLLTPEKSPVYQSERFIATQSRKGAFKKAFAEELLKGNYPKLKIIIGEPPSISSRLSYEWPIIDPTHEIWTDEYGVSIYFPYSENFPFINPNDPNNNRENGNLVTIVSADREADSGPGWEPYYVEYDPNGFNCPDNICYRQVTVDDAYADGFPTHIVGVGAEPAFVSGTAGTNQVYVVFIGEVMFTQQYDKLISFTGNGGGPELRFVRGDGYLQSGNTGQITNATNVISANYKRKHKGSWKAVNSIWDSDWEIGNQEQVFGIYEDDTQGSKTFSGGIQTTLTYTGGTTQIGPIGYSITVQTQDNLIRQINWDRTSFYQYNQGSLNNGCGTRSGWTVYDCNAGVKYTMPTQ